MAKTPPEPTSAVTSQVRQVWAHLEQNGSATKLGLLRKYGILNSGDCIHRIRKAVGYDRIETVMVPNAKGGRHCQWVLRGRHAQLTLSV